jgi:hypothetical protein
MIKRIVLAIWVALISFPVANWRISPQQFIFLSPAPGDLSSNIFYFLSPIWRTGYPQIPFFIASWRVNFIFFANLAKFRHYFEHCKHIENLPAQSLHLASCVLLLTMASCHNCNDAK